MNEIRSIIGQGKKYSKIQITRQHKSKYYTQKIPLQYQQQVQLGPYLVLSGLTAGSLAVMNPMPPLHAVCLIRDTIKFLISRADKARSARLSAR